MVTSREIVRDLFHQALRPNFLAGFACSCGIFAAFFPLFYCPCTGHQSWLSYVQLTGSLVWLVAAGIGAAVATTSEQRTVYLVAAIAAPVVCWVMLSLSVSR